MNLQAKKLNLIEWLLKLQDETILDKIELLKKHSVDHWDDLTDEQKAEIDSSINELDANEGILHEEVMRRLRQR